MCLLYILVLMVFSILLHRQWEMYRCRYPGSSFLGALASYDMTRKEVEAAEEKVEQHFTILNNDQQLEHLEQSKNLNPSSSKFGIGGYSASGVENTFSWEGECTLCNQALSQILLRYSKKKYLQSQSK